MKRCSAPFCALACLATLGFASSGSAELIYGIAAVGNSTNLVTWDSATPGNLTSGTFLTGLQVNETIVGLDFRPATGQLYGLGSSSRLYTISPGTGQTLPVNVAPFSPPLNGFNFGFDFNPTIDLIRNVAETNMNRVLDPNTGLVQLVATDLFYHAGDPNAGADPNVVHSAYWVPPQAGGSQLYGIDSGFNTLVTQANNTGILSTVGPLGVDVGAVGGFDVSTISNNAYAAMLPAGSSVSQFYSIDVATGAATSLGVIDGGLIITAMTVTPIPEPATLGLLGMGLAACLFARRKAG